ncbi:hypothetical protein AB205_0199520 [Aquarana catesbeiana]|uniref:Uncharacterized protein n=1 Tax=Aquarana catesbeiana TaxID=8400 RepID=A0A2G9S5K4_AQUCT|nr:hypothetical protein AB205_0199520 [Aquarana catesbeiana]
MHFALICLPQFILLAICSHSLHIVEKLFSIKWSFFSFAIISTRTKDRFGSQPGNLDILKEIPLQSAQSDSNLFSTVTAETSVSPEDTSTIPLSPIFRTGSDPVLRAKLQPTQPLDCGGNNALRGSDSQLHSKAPPKPIRAPSLLLPDPPDGTDTYWELVPRVPEASRRHLDTMKVEERWKNRARATETTFGFLDSEKSPDVIQSSKGHFELDNPRNSKPVYSEVAKTKLVHKEVDKSRTFSESNTYKQVHSPEERPKTEQSRTEHLSQPLHKPRLSKMEHVILETAEDEDDFIRPQIQTITSYNPKTFPSILLSPENKPLEPNALRKLKEIVSQRDCKESALHILRENCQVSKIYVLFSRADHAPHDGFQLITLT